LLGGGITEVFPSGLFELYDLVRGARVISVEGRRINALVDPDCLISITHPDLEKGDIL
jgi:hypothetical protein